MLASTNWKSSDVRPGYWPRYASRLFLDHVGGERRAVVERDAGPQRDRPLGGVGVRGHRLGEERDELAVPVGHGQRVVDRPRHLDAGDGELALGQAPAVGGLRLEAVDEAAAVLRSAGVGVVVVTA
jgi:hypothetical protein